MARSKVYVPYAGGWLAYGDGPEEVIDNGPTWVRPSGAGYTEYESLSGATVMQKINATPGGNIVTFPSGVFQQANFSYGAGGNNGICFLPDNSVGGLAGSGRDETFLEITPMSSDRADTIPPQSTGFVSPGSPGTVNLLTLFRLGEAPGGNPAVQVDYLGGMTIRGTDQPIYTIDDAPGHATGFPHCYFGVYNYLGINTLIEDVRIKAIPGSYGANPGESYGYNNYKTNGVLMRRVEVDGTNAAGTKFGATGVGSNSQAAGSLNTFEDVYVHDMRWGIGFTHYRVNGTLIYRRCRVKDVFLSAWNFEHCAGTGGLTVEMIDCIVEANCGQPRPGSPYPGQPIFVIADSDVGSIVINIRNPKVPNGSGGLQSPSASRPVLVVIHNSYGGTTNKQRFEDIHVFDANGVEQPTWKARLTGYANMDGGLQ